MSTTYILEEAEADDDGLGDFLAELDRDLKAPKKPTQKKPAAAWSAPATFEVQWTPVERQWLVTVQVCNSCGHEYSAVAGLFAVSMTRNGAVRRQPFAPQSMPAEFQKLPLHTVHDSVILWSCPLCSEGARG